MRETEFNWFACNPEIMKQYRGEYVAIIGEKVVAHGEHLKPVLEKAEKVEKNPLVVNLPQEEILVV